MTEWRTGPNNAITDVPGIRVGHFTDRKGATGCTVVLCDSARFAAADVRGGAPGTRETHVLDPANVVRTCHAIVLSGGSAFGLAAASGVMRWCEEHEIGFATTRRRVPIVTGAVLYDLGVGDANAFPGDETGYVAASRAKRGAVAEGSVGAGTGATPDSTAAISISVQLTSTSGNPFDASQASTARGPPRRRRRTSHPVLSLSVSILSRSFPTATGEPGVHGSTLEPVRRSSPGRTSTSSSSVRFPASTSARNASAIASL